jgi:hypothetical protein
MTFRELVDDLVSKCPGNPEDVEVLLATRRVNGVLMEDPTKVWLREIAAIEVDEAGLYLIPKLLWTGEPAFRSPVSVSALQAYARENPRLACLDVFVVDSRGETESGRVFSMNLSILGVRVASEAELWIIQFPQEQWPESWSPRKIIRDIAPAISYPKG